MSRYPRLIVGLAFLALAYWALGGFGQNAPAPEEEPPEVQQQADSTLESSEDGIGGPDDGLSLGLRPQGDHPPILEQVGDWDEVTIGRNESFYVALQRNGLEHEQIMEVVDAAEPHVDLSRVRRGDTFNLAKHEGQLQAVRFDIDQENFLVVQSDSLGAMRAEVARYAVDRLVRVARGEIETNLFDALLANGADPALADQLAEILGWNIDFFRDLRVGDSFEVLYAEYRRESQTVRDPEVLAVHFTNKGETTRAYRFENEYDLPAYYDHTGDSLERQFLRAPLKFSRISSNFSHRRLHPVLKRYRPHYGVDYAAPTGTPVFATSDGKIIKRTRDKASGIFVGIRHGNGYESYYLHLSRFAKGQSVGKTVKQGEVIGYVGNTGWSTAPHLDYRIKRNGKWVNPRKLDLPPADPVTDEMRPTYVKRVEFFDGLMEDAPTNELNFILSRSPAPVSESVATR
jgi:murein DD-endopeptidase MepM/ murein hydrolase activator NlpD